MVKTPHTHPRRKKYISSSDSDDPLDSIPDLAPPVRPAKPDDPLDVIGISSSPSPSPPSFFRTPNRPPPPSVTRRARGMSTGGRWGQRGSGSRDVDRRGSAPVARASGSAKRRRIDAPYREDGELEEAEEEIEEKPEYRDGSPRAIKRELLPAGPGKSLLARLGPPPSSHHLYEPYRPAPVSRRDDFDDGLRRLPPTAPRSQRMLSESEEERRPGLRHSLPARPKLEVKEESEPEEEEEIEERVEERDRLPSVGRRDRRASSGLPPRPRSPYIVNRNQSRELLPGPSNPASIPSREADAPDDTSAEWPDVPSTDDEDRLGLPHYLRPAEPVIIDSDPNDSRPDTPPLPDDFSPITFLSRPTITPPHLGPQPTTPPIEAEGDARPATPPITNSSRPPTPALPPRTTDVDEEEEEEEEAEESVEEAEEASEAEEEIEAEAAEENAAVVDLVPDTGAVVEPVSVAASEAAEDIVAEEDVSMTLPGVTEEEDEAPPVLLSPLQECGKKIQMEPEAAAGSQEATAPIVPDEVVPDAASEGIIDVIESAPPAEEADAVDISPPEIEASADEESRPVGDGGIVSEQTRRPEVSFEADAEMAAMPAVESDITVAARETPAGEGMEGVETSVAPAGPAAEVQAEDHEAADALPEEGTVEPAVDITESGMDGVEEEAVAPNEVEAVETVEAVSADFGEDGTKANVRAVGATEEADVASAAETPAGAEDKREIAKQTTADQNIPSETSPSDPSTAEPAPFSADDTIPSDEILPTAQTEPALPPSQSQLPTPPPSTALDAPGSPLPQAPEPKEATPPLSPRVPADASAPFTPVPEKGPEDVEMGASAPSPVRPPSVMEEEGEEEIDPADREAEEDLADHTSPADPESTSKRGESSDMTDINTPTPVEPVIYNKDGSVRKKGGRVPAPKPPGWKSWHKGNYTYENGVAIKKVKEPAGKKGKVEALKSAARGRSNSSPISDASDTPLAAAKPSAPAEKKVVAEETADDDDDDDEEVWCSCGRRSRPDGNDMMIGCDGCDNWFHAGCVKLSKEEVDLVDTFFCPDCEKTTGKRTTIKRTCKRDGCEKVFSPKRSKFCSDNCAYRHAQTIVAGMQNKKQLKQLADALANYPSPPPDIRIIDHHPGPSNPSSALNSFFPVLPDPIEVLTKRIEASQALITILEKRLAILAKASEQCESLPPLNPQNGDEGGKKKRKTEGGDDRPCGWVGALIWEDVEVGAWEVGMPVGNEVRVVVQAEVEGGEDVEMGEEEVGVGYCLNPRKRCDRHLGWQKIMATSLDMELSQLQETLSNLSAERDYLVNSAEARQAGKAAQENLHEILAMNLAKKFV